MSMRSLGSVEWTVVVLVVALQWGCARVDAPRATTEDAAESRAHLDAIEDQDPGRELSHEAAKAVDIGALRLRFEIGQTATYAYSWENTRFVEWRGVSDEDRAALRSGTSGRVIRMVLTENVRAIDDLGRATVDITIDALSYRVMPGQVHVDLHVDYDSAREGQEVSALADLLGKTYTILKTSAGGVHGVIDSGRARAGLDPNKPDFDLARQLLSDPAITERHTVKAMASNKDPLPVPGQVWIETQHYGFGQMGSRTFDKVYTYRGIRKESGSSMALVEMSAIPSTRSAQRDHEGAHPGPFADVFADEYEFTGRMTLNIETGVLDHYSESLEMRWAGVDPQADPGDASPASVHLIARQRFAYER